MDRASRSESWSLRPDPRHPAGRGPISRAHVRHADTMTLTFRVTLPSENWLRPGRAENAARLAGPTGLGMRIVESRIVRMQKTLLNNANDLLNSGAPFESESLQCSMSQYVLQVLKIPTAINRPTPADDPADSDSHFQGRRGANSQLAAVLRPLLRPVRTRPGHSGYHVTATLA